MINSTLQQRVLGALILMLLAIVILPEVFEKPVTPYIKPIPQAPQLPKPPVNASRPIAETVAPVVSEAVIATPQMAAVPSDTKKKTPDNTLQQPPQQKVLQPASTPPPTEQTPAWTLQVATFARQTNAEQLLEKLKKDNFHAYQRSFQTADKPVLYRIYVGPLLDKNQLVKIQTQLKEQLKLAGVVIRYQPTDGD